jgi:hypothetical protein
MSEPKELEQTTDPEWDGFRRKRWANRYALLFASTFGVSTGLFFASIDIGRNGRGHEVASVVIGIFVLVAITAGTFLGRLLAWRLDQNARRAVMLVTLALGIAVLVGSWMFFRS